MSRQVVRAPRWLVLAAMAACVGAALAGCGSSQLSAQAPPIRATTTTTTPAPADPEPAMVMVTLTDRGYRASDIDVTLGQPVMFMVVNQGTHPHELRAAVPVSSLEVVDPLATGVQPAADRIGPLDLTIPAGHEIDVTFVPSRAGRFAMSDGEVAAGAIVVG